MFLDKWFRIYQGCRPGVPPNEETTYREISDSVGIRDTLLKSGVPGIKEVYSTEMGCAQFKVIVSMDRQFYSGKPRQVMDVVLGPAHGVTWVIVVDDDVDIYDMGQVEWRLAVRIQPHRDIFITDNRCTGISLDPSSHPDLREYPLVQTSRIGIDATTKFRGHELPPVVRSGEEQIKQVERR